MTTVLFDDVVETDYGQFDLVWAEEGGFDGDSDTFFSGQVNGLVGAASPLGLYVVLGRRSGGSSVRIDLHEGEPALDDSWEDIVEVSIVVPEGAQPGWMTWAGEDGGPLAIVPGSYRVRVSARGRDAGHEDEFADGVVDFYLIELWPRAVAPDAILKTTSQNASYWHGAWGSNR